MPELPEVETVRRQLSEVIVGKTIKGVEVRRSKSFVGEPDVLIGKKIEKVSRQAKVIEIYLKNSKQILLVHLKMTGQLVYLDKKRRVYGGHPTPDWIGELPSKHTRVVIDFSDGGKLFFNDMRVFGWLKLTEKEKYEETKSRVAPDVIDKHFTDEYLASVLANRKKPVKLVLLDQEKIGGIGNIYANDALFLAKIKPDRKAASLEKKEITKLHKALVEVIEKGIKYGGASAANYVDLRGLGGSYQEHFLVYKKDGQPCKVCGSQIKKMKMGGRGTFYCEKCQK